jgi:hypothetical protein
MRSGTSRLCKIAQQRARAIDALPAGRIATPPSFMGRVAQPALVFFGPNISLVVVYAPDE